MTLRTPIESWEALNNPNIVKVVCTRNHQALYFSRSPIPFGRNPEDSEAPCPINRWRHVGVYGYQRSSLKQFVEHAQTDPFLETTEQLEQLRALAIGLRIDALPVASAAPGIDCPQDVFALNAYMEKNGMVTPI